MPTLITRVRGRGGRGAGRLGVALAAMALSGFAVAHDRLKDYELVVSGGSHFGLGCTIVEPGGRRPTFRRSVEPRVLGTRDEVCRKILDAREAGACRHVGRRTREICNADVPRGITVSSMQATSRGLVKPMVEIRPASALKASTNDCLMKLRTSLPLASVFSPGAAQAASPAGRYGDIHVWPCRPDVKPGAVAAPRVCPKPELHPPAGMRLVMKPTGAGTDEPFCSATLVAGGTRLVTAAHCLNPKVNEVGLKLADGRTEFLKCVAHPSFAKCGGTADCLWDIAVCQVPGSKLPTEKVMSPGEQLPARARLTVAGFGISPNADGGDGFDGAFCAGGSTLDIDGVPGQISFAVATHNGDASARSGDSGGAVFWPAAGSTSERRLLGVIIRSDLDAKATLFLDLRDKRLCSFLEEQQVRTAGQCP